MLKILKVLIAVSAIIIPASNTFSQEPKRVQTSTSPSSRYQIIETSFGSRNFESKTIGVRNEKNDEDSVSESKVTILLDSQTGDTWYLQASDQFGFSWIPLWKMSDKTFEKLVNEKSKSQ